ncbi:hypothetical protein PhaeoP83_01277 [Phaeobacter inhibens]|uniref:DUF3168 domain-containing protein n=1 Tax=Phaeobacter inhibens TaxID=221822 RepID=A0ABM6RCR9_9RHOB|nr:DUF3168 domain-containing protein [Phaeobacter inhibens]AUQ49567.1 hypothetical protein PhaeoP83_01277 [Phaeobacter inhibens]AUQ94122.1 hypothetical protein PhaeoP66_01324 [Phaeobacter inhibens]AUR19370.1 hypothetical protein PhaeoP80_01277 [Phaeobacter inhibens]
MITPDIQFQTAIRAALTADPVVTALVPADHIRAGSTRPDKWPTIILANPQTMNLGWASQGQKLARVFFDLHIWAVEDGADLARKIGFVASEALWDAPASSVIGIDDYTRPSFTYMRDPDPERAYCHGVGTVEAVLRWRV